MSQNVRRRVASYRPSHLPRINRDQRFCMASVVSWQAMRNAGYVSPVDVGRLGGYRSLAAIPTVVVVLTQPAGEGTAGTPPEGVVLRHPPERYGERLTGRSCARRLPERAPRRITRAVDAVGTLDSQRTWWRVIPNMLPEGSVKYAGPPELEPLRDRPSPTAPSSRARWR
jgi:hypothetical protein